MRSSTRVWPTNWSRATAVRRLSSRWVAAHVAVGHVTVDLLVSGRSPFPDQWIYVHSPDVQMARIANYNNFSPAMSPAPDRTALSVEYFTFQHEDLWKRPDGELVELAGEELARLKLLSRKSRPPTIA